ncbi:hypothetical protein B0H19DRAFT_1347343 [Mycena capillaripes]|nr:hypothetical protein B0H19DRAFT_1347343 [Mycena capillaripes]
MPMFQDATRFGVRRSQFFNVQGDMNIHGPMAPDMIPAQLQQQHQATEIMVPVNTLSPPPVPVYSKSGNYSTQLLHRGRGFPLFVPAPPANLPVQYRRNGVAIGDVGRVTPQGIFDFFFNIYLPADNPINANIPEDFVPLSPYVPADIIPHDFNPRDYVSSPSIHEIQGDFSDWYKYTNETRGRGLVKGSLLLVTGYEKAKSWGMATFYNVPFQNKFQFSFRPTRDEDAGFRYLWQGTHFCHKHADSPPVDGTPLNQTTFIHAFTISVGQGIWGKVFGNAEISQLVDSPTSRDKPGCGFVPYGSQGSSTTMFLSFFGGNVTSGGKQCSRQDHQNGGILSDAAPLPEIFHPSQVIHAHILRAVFLRAKSESTPLKNETNPHTPDIALPQGKSFSAENRPDVSLLFWPTDDLTIEQPKVSDIDLPAKTENIGRQLERQANPGSMKLEMIQSDEIYTTHTSVDDVTFKPLHRHPTLPPTWRLSRRISAIWRTLNPSITPPRWWSVSRTGRSSAIRRRRSAIRRRRERITIQSSSCLRTAAASRVPSRGCVQAPDVVGPPLHRGDRGSRYRASFAHGGSIEGAQFEAVFKRQTWSDHPLTEEIEDHNIEILFAHSGSIEGAQFERQTWSDHPLTEEIEDHDVIELSFAHGGSIEGAQFEAAFKRQTWSDHPLTTPHPSLPIAIPDIAPDNPTDGSREREGSLATLRRTSRSLNDRVSVLPLGEREHDTSAVTKPNTDPVSVPETEGDWRSLSARAAHRMPSPTLTTLPTFAARASASGLDGLGFNPDWSAMARGIISLDMSDITVHARASLSLSTCDRRPSQLSLMMQRRPSTVTGGSMMYDPDTFSAAVHGWGGERYERQRKYWVFRRWWVELHPQKPQQRVTINPFRRPFTLGSKPPHDGAYTNIHKHSKVMAFSIYRHYKPACAPLDVSAMGAGRSMSTGNGDKERRRPMAMILLAPRHVQEAYTSTNITKKLRLHGLLDDGNGKEREDARDGTRSVGKREEERMREKEREARQNRDFIGSSPDVTRRRQPRNSFGLVDSDLDSARVSSSRKTSNEAFSTLDASPIDQMMLAQEARYGESSNSVLSRVLRRAAGPVHPMGTAIPHQVYSPPWVILQSRVKQEERRRRHNVLSNSFEDVGLLPPKKSTGGGRGAKKAPVTGVDIFAQVPPDALFMLLPLWPGPTDPVSERNATRAPHEIPTEQRQYLLVSYEPCEERPPSPGKTSNHDEDSGWKNKGRRASISSMRAVYGGKASRGCDILLTSYCIRARLVSHADLLGSAGAGPWHEALLSMPQITMHGHVLLVIGTCALCEAGVEFDPEPLLKMGLCVPILQDAGTDDGMEEPVAELTPIGKAVLEMAWIGSIAATSFGPAGSS